VNEAKGIKYDYNVDAYPVAKELCDTYTIVHGIHPPNGIDLMQKFVAGFKKVFGTWTRLSSTPTIRFTRAPTASSTGLDRIWR